MEAILNSTFKQMEDITDVHEMTNTQLKRLINKIEVDKDGNVDIYLRLIRDLGLNETVLIDGYESTEGNIDDHQAGSQEAKETRKTKAQRNAKAIDKTNAIEITNITAPNTNNHT